MKLRLSRPATRRLDRVLTDIAQHHPLGARNVQERIRAVSTAVGTALCRPHDSSARHPTHGRPTHPYAITYRVGEDEIIILGVRHTSRRPIV